MWLCARCNDECRKGIADRFGVARTYPDLDTALENAFDASVVATPAHLHVSIATRLAGAEHHLLIEKPLSTGLEGRNRLKEVVKEKGLVAGVAYVYQAHPALAEMKRAVDSGRFGKPVQIVSVTGQHFPTYRPAYREIYYTDRATGGGAVQDAMTHMINYGEWLAGPVERLAADAAHQVLGGVEVEDTVHVLTRKGSVLRSYSLNQFQAPNESSITLVCEEGVARFEVHRHRWRWMVEPGGAWQDEPSGLQERDEIFIRQANAFLDAIERGAEPLCSLYGGIKTLGVNLAILE